MQSHHFWLSDKQFERLQPLLPNKTRGVPRVDDRRVISGIIHVLRHGLMWRDAPVAYGPHKTLYNRFVRWSEAGVFGRIFATLAAESTATHTVMIDATHLKAHRTAASAQKGAVPRRIRRTKGGLNSKLHAACDADGKPLILLLTEGQVSDYRGADTMLPAFPDADDLIADRGYDSDRFRQALLDLGIEPCIPGRSNREEEILYDKALYKQRNLIERMFGRLKDWRRIATRYDRCAHTFMSAICIAATVIFWL
ncbi:IS5 family transposase [Magnetospira sp. QH-2]|uniref:IS5 family transposase n=1 Tax=Magnetospira sp. (strain QH-2) TaxID=1288970 RepID=UPI0011DCEBD6|nr:IS5 family transposase [Magnetospira sp. QH-2]